MIQYQYSSHILYSEFRVQKNRLIVIGICYLLVERNLLELNCGEATLPSIGAVCKLPFRNLRSPPVDH
jgi:hypothetical protein